MLASSSKARRRLLDQAGVPFLHMASGVKEELVDQSEPTKLVEVLAKAKASAIVRKFWELKSDHFSDQISEILGCDSVFEFNGEIFGKPLDSIEAIKRWRLMTGRSGFLHTGHALYSRKSSFAEGHEGSSIVLKCQVITTRVDFVEMTLKEITNYVATGEPLRCAGGFALEGLGGMFISRIEGCYTNVIGLSLPWLRSALLL